MDILSPPKACDPWAVHSAQTFLKGKDKLSTLTPPQSKIVQYIQERGEATAEEIIKNLQLTEEELRREFVALRHMEILKATKKGNNLYIVLENPLAPSITGQCAASPALRAGSFTFYRGKYANHSGSGL
jgi:hypothetical protein